MLEAMASVRHIRVTPQKARRVVDLIRGKQATEAVTILKFAPQAASEPVYKVLESRHRERPGQGRQGVGTFDEQDLSSRPRFVDEGPTLKRFQPRAQGRAVRINKRTSHITVVLATPRSRRHGPEQQEGEPANGSEGQPLRLPSGHHHRPRVALVRRLDQAGSALRATTSRKTSRSVACMEKGSTAPASPRSRSSAPVTASASTSTPPARAS